MADMKTIQSNIKSSSSTDSITDYALFMGGTNVTHDVLYNYDPLKTGYGRLFMIRKPVFLDQVIPNKLKKFKHILEYGNTAVSGINDIQVQFNQISGGYTGKSFEIPSFASDDTNAFQVRVYEFSGSPVREVLHTWINGTTDLLTGLSTYYGIDERIGRLQANQTAEFIYVATDNTGKNVEYACMFANCFPKNINMDAFNYTAGEHNLVETTIEFTCTKYDSIQINEIAQALINKYRLLANSLNFYSGIDVDKIESQMGRRAFGYDVATGKMSDAKANVSTEAIL